MKYKLSILIFLLCSVIVVQGQTEEQVAERLKQRGITSEEDVQKALEKRNMTEADARRLAEQYGMDYDTFLKTYIMNKKPSSKVQRSIKPDSAFFARDTATVRERQRIKPDTTKVKAKKKTVSKRKEGLNYFGYDLFKNIPASFKPSEVGPVDPGYIIGPSDVLRLVLWGEVELQYELQVDKQGNIFIPTAGQIFVSGVAYKDLKDKLKNYLSKFYEGLTEEPPTIFLDISLAELRPIRIFVMGEVPQPGGYNISSYATVFNALYSVGGPLKSGSLREIRVIRDNEVIATVDVYDYLLKGKLIGDLRLQNNDMIFVPPRKKTVSVKGKVRRPAIYELQENENLKTLLDFCGGLKATAYTGRAQVNRVKPFNKRNKDSLDKEIIDFKLSKYLNSPKNFRLFDNDKLTIFSILEDLENYATINGEVYRPGTYEIKPNMELIDLIDKAKGLRPEAYRFKADVMRTKPNESYEFFSVNPSKALNDNPEHNIKLKNLDKITIYSIYDVVDKKSVSISGYVKDNVTMPYADSLTLYDLVFKAGGLKDPFFRGKAFALRGDVVRINDDGYTTRIIPFNLDSLLNEDMNMDIKPGDNVYIYKADVQKVLDKFVQVRGEVRKPDTFQLSTNMTPKDLILRAGGYNEYALKTQIFVNRNIVQASGDTLTRTYALEVDSNLAVKNKDDFQLQHRDIVIVRKDPDFEEQRIVNLRGEVKFPGTYVLKKKNETVLDLINQAGGPSSEAYLFGATYNRGGRRLIVDLEELYYEKDESENILLKDGDDIFIPQKSYTVSVTGEINAPGLFKYVPGLSVEDYIERAGGETDSAKYAIYRKTNGESFRVDLGWFSSDPEVFDGSSIHVTKVPPPEPESDFDVGATIKDVFAILSSAATLIYLISRVN